MAKVFPVVKKTVPETHLKFNFIRKDENGKLYETEEQIRVLNSRSSKNSLQIQLQKEFPDEVINILTVKTEKIEYTMSAEKFMELADKQLVEEPTGEQTELPLDESEATVETQKA